MITISDVLACEQHLDKVEAVIFDLDDTLYSEKDYVRSGYRAVAAVFPNVADMEQKLWAAFEKRLPAIDVVLQAEGLLFPEEKEIALQVYRSHMPAIEMYAGVEALLQRLKQQKKLGLITDGRPEGQWAKIRTLRIEEYFDMIIVTDELGGSIYRKPNEAAFRLMQQVLDVPFEKMVYIGDNKSKDFIAPKKLGMQAIYFKNEDGLYMG